MECGAWNISLLGMARYCCVVNRWILVLLVAGCATEQRWMPIRESVIPFEQARAFCNGMIGMPPFQPGNPYAAVGWAIRFDQCMAGQGWAR